ncbi:MAG: hypothetical protein MI799_08915 [Desulfobacterales bacterium]|nr:hypothetical protein [Desulfobacterales bacterium]
MPNKSIKRVQIISAAAVVALILGYVMLQANSPEKNNKVKPAPDALLSSANKAGLTQSDLDHVSGEINEELALLRNHLDMLRANQQALKKDIEDFQPAPVANNIQDGQDVKEGDDIRLSTTSPIPVEQKVQQQEVMLEQAFYAQEPDPQWADETLDKLYAGFESREMQGIHLVDASCASTMCQMDIVIDQDASMEDSLQHLAHHRSWDGPTFVAANQSGQIKIYFARDGHDLPNPDTDEPAYP